MQLYKTLKELCDDRKYLFCYCERFSSESVKSFIGNIHMKKVARIDGTVVEYLGDGGKWVTTGYSTIACRIRQDEIGGSYRQVT